MNKQTTLIAEVALLEDMERNADGLDQKVLAEATKVKDMEFSDPVDAATLILQLTKEGLL